MRVVIAEVGAAGWISLWSTSVWRLGLNGSDVRSTTTATTVFFTLLRITIVVIHLSTRSGHRFYIKVRDQCVFSFSETSNKVKVGVEHSESRTTR